MACIWDDTSAVDWPCKMSYSSTSRETLRSSGNAVGEGRSWLDGTYLFGAVSIATERLTRPLGEGRGAAPSQALLSKSIVPPVCGGKEAYPAA